MAEEQVPSVYEGGDYTVGEQLMAPSIATQDPVLGLTGPYLATARPQTKTLEEAALADIEKQKEEGITIQDVLEGKVTSFGGITVTPDLLQIATTDKSAVGNKTRQKIIQAITLENTREPEVMIPFARGQDVVVPPEVKDPLLKDKITRRTNALMATDNLLFEAGVQDPVIRQIFVDEFRSGEFYETLNGRVGQVNEFLATGIPNLAIIAYDASEARIQASVKGTSFSDEWAALSSRRTNSFKKVADTISGGLFGQESPVVLSNFFNGIIEKKLREKLENNEITEEEFNRLAYVTDESGNPLLQDGNPVRKEYINGEIANNLIDLSMNKLPANEQFAVMFIENIIPIGGVGQARTMNSLRKWNRTSATLMAKYDETTEIGKVLRSDMDPVEILNFLDKQKIKHNINKNYLSVALKQVRVEESLETTFKQIEVVGTEMDAMLLNGVSRKSAEFLAKKGEYESLVGRAFRARFTLKTKPYFKQAVGDAIVVSAGQQLGRTYFPYVGVSPEAGEALGAITTVFGGWSTVKFAGRTTRKLVEGVGDLSARKLGLGLETNLMGISTRGLDALAWVGTFGSAGAVNLGILGKYSTGLEFTDKTLLRFEEATGVKLTSREIEGVRGVLRMMNSLPRQQQDEMLAAVDEYVDLRDRIINYFPEGPDRLKAEELFNMSFASVSNISALRAVADVNAGRLDVRNLAKYNLEEAIEAQNLADGQVIQTEMLLKNMEDLISNSGLVGADKAAVDTWIEGTRELLQIHKKDLNARRGQQIEQLQEIKKLIHSDPTIDIPENFIVELIDAEERLVVGTGEVFDRKLALNNASNDIWQGLNEKVEHLRSVRNRPKQHRQALNLLLEDTMDTHMEISWAKGDAAYSAVREASEQANKIDLSVEVREMANMAGETAFDQMFNPDGIFFQGKMGRLTRRVFDDMALRSLGDDIQGIKDDLFRQKLITQDEYKSIKPWDLAMRIVETGVNPDFNPFSELTAYDVDVIRRGFVDYAYRTGDGGLAKSYKGYAAKLDGAIRRDAPEVMELLEQARENYRAEVGDRFRQGGYLKTLDNSREGGMKMVLGESDMTRYAYRNVTPGTLFNDISKNISKIIEGGRGADTAEENLATSLSSIIQEFGSVMIDPDTGAKIKGFDLSDENQLNLFNTLSEVMSEKVWSDWADVSIQQWDRTSESVAEMNGGYVFKQLRDQDYVNSLLTVPVIKDGRVINQPLVNISNVYADNRDISKLVQANKQVRKQYDDLKDDFNNLDSNLRRTINETIEFEDEALDILKKFTGDLDPDSFYSSYILNGSEIKTQTLKKTFIEASVKAGKSKEDAEQLFNTATANLISRALLNRGGMQPRRGMKPTQLGSFTDSRYAREFVNPQVLYADIQDNKDVLISYLGSEHVEYLESMADWLKRNEDLDPGTLAGLARPMTINEKLSRVYNIARGMVSPLYVTSEFAIRASSAANINLIQMAAENREAARIISMMFETPELVTRQDIDTFDNILNSFVFGMMGRNDMFLPEAEELFLLPEEKKDEDEQ